LTKAQRRRRPALRNPRPVPGLHLRL